VDFLEDTSVNLLILLALSWSLQARARIGMALAAILLVPALATLWALWSKWQLPVPPAPTPLTLTGLGALAVNFSCAMLLTRFRHDSGSLTRAAFLSARNDVFANIGIVLAGLITALVPSVLPDVIVGIGIMLINADAAHDVWRAARQERLSAQP
jgi:Co/Zn/Cd efflux system component